jgi:Tol biopolymer transport system component
LCFSADDTYLYRCLTNGVKSIEIYKRSGDTFTTLTAPSDMSSEAGRAIAASPDGKFVALGLGASDRLWIYERDGDTFTKLPNLAYRPADGTQIQGLAFSPDSAYLAVSIAASPYIVLYSISGSTFTRVTPSGLPTTSQYGIAYSNVLTD